MHTNQLTIVINRPVQEVFDFVITPPNSVRWIDGVVNEETNEWPVKVGTVYRLKTQNNRRFKVAVTAMEPGKSVEWVSADGDYHCRYVLKPLAENRTRFKYYEWVDRGELNDPFSPATLDRLKAVMEAPPAQAS